jgi:hypothetical protein
MIKLNELLTRFEKISSNLPKTDINQYDSFSELSNAISEYDTKQRRKVKKVQGGNVVYEDGRFFIVNPLTYDSSCYYGKGTKWCTAASTDASFHKYNDEGKLFYVIDTQLPTSNPYYKVAILKKFDGETSYWDAKDDSIKEGWILGNEKINEINSAIDSYMNEYFSEQIKVFRDKELAKKEKARLESLRIKRIMDQKLAQMDELRSTDEWNLSNPNIDEDGLKANALFQYLIDENDIEPLDAEDRIRIREINQQIEQLQQEYDSSDETKTELLDRISELEDELENYEGKIDIYHLYPNGEFYDMTKFEVLDSDLYGNEYAVGTTSELEDSAKEYVEQLIDDIGYDGFSKGFAENYIDIDEVVENAKDTYHYDVSESPDSYLDDSQRELSDDQISLIEKHQRELEKMRSYIEKYQELMDNSEDMDLIDEYQDKIDELEELIDDIEIEIDEINDSPDGDFPEHLIEEKVDELVSEVERNPIWYMNEVGLEIKDYIDKEKFIEGVIDSDGLGIVNGYDGNYEEIKINGEYYAVMRII